MTAGERLPYGQCPACRHSYQLTAKGVLRVHYDGRQARWDGRACQGSGLPPKGAVR